MRPIAPAVFVAMVFVAPQAVRSQGPRRDTPSDSIAAVLSRTPDFPALQAPMQGGDRTFFFEPSGSDPQPVVYVEDARAPLRLLLDANSLSTDGSVLLTAGCPSPDGKYFAYGLARPGSAWQEIRVRDAGSAHDLSDTLRGVLTAPVAWTHDGKGFFYVAWKNRGGADYALIGPAQVFYHAMGSPQGRDPLIYDRPDRPDLVFRVKVSSDGAYAVIESRSGEALENRLSFIDLDNPKRPSVRAPVVRLIDDEAATYDFIDSRGSSFLLRTTQGAPHGRLIALDINAPDPSRWHTIVRETFDPLVAAIVVANRIVTEHVQSARPSLEIYALDGSPRGEIAAPGSGTINRLAPGGDEPELFFQFTSPLDPPTLYRYNFDQRTTVVYRRPPGAFDASGFEATQLFFASTDGTRVPLLIVARRGIVLDGTHPALLTAIGALGTLAPVDFSLLGAAWLQLGGVYAIAGIRGGGEEGRVWHDAGSRREKAKSIADLTAAAQFLIDQRYTRTKSLAVLGRGHGALAVAGLETQHPDLVGAVIVEDGLLDMLHFDLYTVGWMWRSEYGSPNTPTDRPVVSAYDPVSNARPGAYPPTFVTVRDGNDWIVPVHGERFVTALQTAQTGPDPIVLRREAADPHGTAAASQRALARDELLFLQRTVLTSR